LNGYKVAGIYAFRNLVNTQSSCNTRHDKKPKHPILSLVHELGEGAAPAAVPDTQNIYTQN